MNKKPKIVLLQVSGDTYEYWDFYPPLGLASIASYLKVHNKVPKNNLLILDSKIPVFKRIILAFKPDIIGISCFSNNYQRTVQVARELKKLLPNTLFILGGVHISLFPDTLDGVFDFAVLKEGEVVFSEIIDSWSNYQKSKNKNVFFDIKSIAYKNKNKIITTPIRELIFPLDNIPQIDYSLLPNLFFRYEIVKDNEKQLWSLKKVFPLFTARGCPYKCIFCARSALWERVRFFSPKRIVDEIKNLQEYGVEAIQIWDDIFALNTERLLKIEKSMKKAKILKNIQFYRVFARTDLFTTDMVKQLKKLNVKSVAFGLESGSERILKYLKRDTTTVKINTEAVDLCEKENIGFVACIMLGIPNEKPEDMDKTLKFIENLNSLNTLEAIDTARATPFPATELYEYAIKKGLISEDFGTKSKYLSLVDTSNEIPILIKNKKDVKAYKFYWKKIKSYEESLRQLNSKQKGYKLSFIKMKILNKINRFLFLPKYLLNLIKKRRWVFTFRICYFIFYRFLEKFVLFKK
ncbi:MAG: radical SAM protein [Patescibacteria group bacterium]